MIKKDLQTSFIFLKLIDFQFLIETATITVISL
jgi:hypothetical protein